MAFLSNLFARDSAQDDSSSASSSDIFSDLDAVLGINISNENYSHSVDDDGSSDTTWSAQNVGTDLDLGNVLAGMFDSMNETDG